MAENETDIDLPSESPQHQDDQGKRKDKGGSKSYLDQELADVVLQVGNKKLLQVSKPGSIIDNDQEID